MNNGGKLVRKSKISVRNQQILGSRLIKRQRLTNFSTQHTK